MATQLAIDVGNSRTKYGLFVDRSLKSHGVIPNEEVSEKMDYLNEIEADHLIISTTNGTLSNTILHRLESYRALQLDHTTPLPIQIDYETPLTLGKDRIALVVAAQALYPQKNCLVIDAGSCITYDFISNQGVYQGGAISPGIQMRLKAMNEHTDALPLLSWQADEKPKNIGKSTISSMLSGAVNGIIGEMNEFIGSYQRSYDNLTVIISGGDSDFFGKELKNTIFAYPNLVLIGLNEILIYNRS